MKIYELIDKTKTGFGVTTASNAIDAYKKFHQAWQQPCYQFNEWSYRTNEASETSFCIDPFYLDWSEDLTVIEYDGVVEYVG